MEESATKTNLANKPQSDQINNKRPNKTKKAKDNQ